MKRGTLCSVRLERCLWRNARYLGRGSFCTAFRLGDVLETSQDVILYSVNDIGKELLMWVDSPHVPKAEHIDTETWNSQHDVRAYRMPYIENLTAKHKEAWRQYKAMGIGMTTAHLSFIRKHGIYVGMKDVYDRNRMFLKAMRKHSPALPESLLEALEELSDNMCNYGQSVGFDMHKSNFGVSEGRLILRDVCADFAKVGVRVGKRTGPVLWKEWKQ